MGTDCSMILHDNRLSRLRTKEERISLIRSIEDSLIKKYGIANRDEAIGFEDFRNDNYLRFNFTPYGILAINLIYDYWEIETTWRYNAYFASEEGLSDMPAWFYEIAQDFGYEEGYICEVYVVDEVDDRPFDEWIHNYGEIPELSRETQFGGYDGSFPRIFHESFQYEKKQKLNKEMRESEK